MISRRQIDDFVSRLVERYEPEKVILFGSYAYGKPTPGSDVDVLVVMNTSRAPIDQAAQILLALRPAIPIELIVRTPEDIADRLATNDYFMQDIFDQGVVLYESARV